MNAAALAFDFFLFVFLSAFHCAVKEGYRNGHCYGCAALAVGLLESRFSITCQPRRGSKSIFDPKTEKDVAITEKKGS